MLPRELFAERGVEATTMDDIARAAGMSRTSVFNYFGYKEMILCEIGARYVQEVAGPVLQDLDRSPERLFRAVAEALADAGDPRAGPDRGRGARDDPSRSGAAPCAQETMGYPAVVDQMLDSLPPQGVLRHPEQRESYGNQLVDLLSGVAGPCGRRPCRAIELRREIERYAGAVHGRRAARAIGRAGVVGAHLGSLRERERQPLLSRRLRARDRGDRSRRSTRRPVPCCWTAPSSIRAAAASRRTTAGCAGADGATWTVTGARKQGDDIWHAVEGEPPAVGDCASRAELDWERRHALMRTHSALHVLCGVIWRDHQASVTGGNMEPLSGRMDFEFETMHGELVAEIERRVNEEVAADREIRVAILPRDEAFAIPDLIRTKINLLPEGISEVRTIEIVGLDLQADGGTHVARTSEIGRVRVTGYESKGRINKRIRIEVTDA